MKIALIMPKGNTYSFNNRSVFFKYMPDCLTMGMLFAIIKKSFPEIELELYDETVENFDKEKIKADLVGISSMTSTFNKAVEYAKYFKSKNIPVFVGGVHATLCPEECALYFDSVISGLANESLPKLISDFKNGDMKRIYYQPEDMSFVNFVQPERNIYEKKHFLGTELNMVQATYGCTNVCEFCVQPYVCCGYHQRPVDDVIEEIKEIKDTYIEFTDPNLSKDEEYLFELCEKLKPLNKSWFAPMTIAIAKNENLLSVLKASGCEGVLIGFESVSSASIMAIKKGFNQTDEYKSAVKKIHDYGIKVTGSFVLGLDGDDESLVQNTLNFVNDAHIDYVRYTINTPYPGTSYYKKMKEEGRIIENNYALYDCQNCVIKPLKLSSEAVEKMHKMLWKKSYSLINIIKRLSYIKPFGKRLKEVIKNYIFGKVYIKMIFKDKEFIKNIKI
ncbi:MAG: radical SAM protein [Clostridium sp.]|nr:radical SAM protein [Clostridium sp.]